MNRCSSTFGNIYLCVTWHNDGPNPSYCVLRTTFLIVDRMDSIFSTIYQGAICINIVIYLVHLMNAYSTELISGDFQMYKKESPPSILGINEVCFRRWRISISNHVGIYSYTYYTPIFFHAFYHCCDLRFYEVFLIPFRV